LRLVSRRWQRYGRAAVRIGTPRPLNDFLTQPDAQGRRFNELPRTERLARAQVLADDVMRDIARLVPVTPVTLVCAALRTFPAEFVPRAALLERIDDLRDRLTAAGAAVVRTDRTPAETFDVAYRMLRMRRVIARVGDGLLVLPHGRALIYYCANAIAYFTDSLTFDPPRPV
jgi:glycerol-3-phosphate O-acyltransferase